MIRIKWLVIPLLEFSNWGLGPLVMAISGVTMGVGATITSQAFQHNAYARGTG